jgi:hypothetical protein
LPIENKIVQLQPWIQGKFSLNTTSKH